MCDCEWAWYAMPCTTTVGSTAAYKPHTGLDTIPVLSQHRWCSLFCLGLVSNLSSWMAAAWNQQSIQTFTETLPCYHSWNWSPFFIFHFQQIHRARFPVRKVVVTVCVLFWRDNNGQYRETISNGKYRNKASNFIFKRHPNKCYLKTSRQNLNRARPWPQWPPWNFEPW